MKKGNGESGDPRKLRLRTERVRLMYSKTFEKGVLPL